jgi:threonine-phosphate decarboxylase
MRYVQGMHGGELSRAAASFGIKAENLTDFSGNANVFAAEITRRLCRGAPYPFINYPASDCGGLCAAIAAHEAVQPENVLCGNGAAELIWLTLRVLAPQSVLFLGPVFSEWIRACNALGIGCQIITPPAEVEFACTGEILNRLWESRAELAVLCSPNNPGGITYDNLGNILAVLRTPRVLVDLSYREFLHGKPEYAWHSWPALHSARGRGAEIYSLHSFTKFFCCPGIRLGYLVGEGRSIAGLAAQTPAWSVGTFAQNMGLAFLEHLDEYRNSLKELVPARYDLGANLWRMELFDQEFLLEGPNFFCCGLRRAERESGRKGRAGKLQNELLRQGVLVRDCDNIPGMPPGFVRIQVRGRDDNEKLLHALRKIR